MSSGQEVGEIFGDGVGPATALLRSPTVLVAAVGLWGANVFLFRAFGIDYAKVLTLDLAREREAAAGGAARGEGGDDDFWEDAATDEDEGATCGDRGGGGGSLEKRHGHGGGNASSSAGAPSSAPLPPLSGGGGPSTPSKPRGRKGRRRDSLRGTGGSAESDDEAVTSSKLVGFSLSLLLLLHLSSAAWIHVLGGSTIGAIFAFYAAVAVGIALPLPSTKWIRRALATVFHRTFELVNPRCLCLQSGVPRAVPFVDVFFADAMCSLSKVFFDWGMLWHLAWHYPDPVPMELHSIAIPSMAASLPYLIRARQCLVMHSVGTMKGDPKRYQHTLNAIKYSTSLWPLVVSAYQKVVESPEEKAKLERVLVALFVVNSTYSLAWDIVMDWGMMQDPQAMVPETCAGGAAGAGGGGGGTPSKPPKSCARAVLRNRLRFGASTSIAILLVDTVLRYSWLLRFWEKDLFPTSDAYILCTQFLEAFRRALWNLLRVEWENIKQNRGKEAERDDVELAEKEPFLPVSAMAMSPRTAPTMKSKQES
ncbi:hypothetical protein ACHAWF_005392 [Thalassiosira exigua]